ncbi:hypothetical protein JK229_13565 [Pantoea dispersa]|uniref:hypothetical protein n=1 Tax=Pantoea dispersa TaxID=59814 RepID=UPI001BA85585|nr:hypothetical protein [Pantoea dispersa]MBS0906155.1 hypothetical protein [Pantoea dispersa]
MGKVISKKAANPGKPKKIIIALSCHFALTGLREVCQPLQDYSLQTLQIAPEAVAEELMFNYADLLITELPHDATGLADLLLIPEWFTGNTIILLDRETQPMHQTLIAAGFSAVMCKSDRAEILRRGIRQQLQRPLLRYDNIASQDGRSALAREKRVLLALLRGIKPARIAREMGVHPREISRIKSSSLARSGFPSLNAMLACAGKRPI